MKYKLWWVLAFLLILGDAGITYWAITGGHGEEKNPAVKNAIESVGLPIALLLGVLLRASSLALCIGTQMWLPEYEWTMPLIGVTVQAPPFWWNVAILFF